MQLFYNPNISDSDASFIFPKDESRHIIKVLRKSVGDTIHITNGRGDEFVASIIQADIKKCVVEIQSKITHDERPYKLHLAVAPTKMNDRFEWFLEKATEIGIDTITPIICEHSERKVVKTDRLEKIVQSAMKQSLQTYLPEIKPLITFNDFVSKNHSGQRFIAHCEEGSKVSLKSSLEQNSEVLVLIGPEGDFSVKEIEMALTHSFKPVTLGETRLRTETAAIVACHTVALINE